MSKARTPARVAVVRRVAQDILPAEAAIDAAFAELTRFASTIPQARVDASLSTTVGQPIFLRLAETIAALVDARGCLVEAHAEMHKVGEDMGIVALGPLDKSLASHDHVVMTVPDSGAFSNLNIVRAA